MTALRVDATSARIRYPRTARAAAQRRATRNARSRYADVVRITVGVVVILVVALSYVLLTSNITSLAYAVDRAHEQRTELQAQVARNDDEIASMTSDDRLAAVAAELGMVQPSQFVRISLSAPQQARPLAFLPR